MLINDPALTRAPLLSIAQLKRSGLFDEDYADAVLGYAAGSVEYLIRLVSPNKIRILIEKDRVHWQQDLTLTSVPIQFGLRRYLNCQKTNQPCNALYLDGPFLVSHRYLLNSRSSITTEQRKQLLIQRQLDRLIGTNEKGAARGANRRKLIREIKLDGWIRHVARPRAAAFDAAVRTANNAARRAKIDVTQFNPMSGQAGFENGSLVRSSVDRIESEDLLLRYGGQSPSGQRCLPSAFVEDCRFLTITDLQQAELLIPGRLSVRTLEWSERCRLQIECHIFDPRAAFVLVRSRFGDYPPQLIRLQICKSTERWYFECPFTGKRSFKLFYRNGLFGSAEGNRLIHRSQRKTF